MNFTLSQKLRKPNKLLSILKSSFVIPLIKNKEIKYTITPKKIREIPKRKVMSFILKLIDIKIKAIINEDTKGLRI